jgi:NHLM bacteriocin system ABC transporter peptidase/ATP-binding protein
MKRVPMILQMEAVECGAACLAMVLGHYGRHVTLAQLRVDCAVSRDGTKASNILNAARRYGLEARGYKKEPQALPELALPLILFWNFNHFVVLESIRKDGYHINDPAIGRRVIASAEFDQAFTGVVLALKKGESFEPGGEAPSAIPALKRRASVLLEPLPFLVALGLLGIVPALALAALSAVFVDAIVVSQRSDWLWPVVGAFFGVSVLATLLNLVENYTHARLMTKIALVGTSGFMWHLLRLPTNFFSQRSLGELSDRVLLNEEVSNDISEKMFRSLVDAASALVFGVVLVWIDWTIALAVTLLVVFELAALRRVAPRIAEAGQRVAIDGGKLHGATLTGLSIIESIKASGSEPEFFSRWAGYQARLMNSMQHAARTGLGISILPELVQTLSGVVLLGLGSYRVMDGHLTLGTLVALQTLAVSFIGPLSRLANLSNVVQEIQGSLNRLDDVLLNPSDPVLAAPPARPEAPPIVRPEVLRGEVRMSGVSFGYSPAEPPLLRDFELLAEPGKRIALVGPSGCGKSTVARLLMGMFQPWSGDILIDGRPRCEYDRVTLASSLVMVDQDIALFHASIRDNLALWDDTISGADILQAAQDAQVHTEIMRRPGGYDFVLSEGGYDLSGGQRQRLEIARALARNPRILILDEGTSALDAVTEALVDDSLRRRGCTCITVAHRLNTVRNADEIIVLRNGITVERGRHDELSTAGGLYSELVAA